MILYDKSGFFYSLPYAKKKTRISDGWAFFFCALRISFFFFLWFKSRMSIRRIAYMLLWFWLNFSYWTCIIIWIHNISFGVLSPTCKLKSFAVITDIRRRFVSFEFYRTCWLFISIGLRRYAVNYRSISFTYIPLYKFEYK